MILPVFDVSRGILFSSLALSLAALAVVVVALAVVVAALVPVTTSMLSNKSPRQNDIIIRILFPRIMELSEKMNANVIISGVWRGGLRFSLIACRLLI